MSSPAVVLVTGATGFIGGHLLPRLAGSRVRVALRTAARSASPLPGCETVVVGDMDGCTDWTGPLADVDTVVHLAAHVHVMQAAAADRRLFHQTNTLGTEQLAQAAARSGVKRFIFLSSIKVNGEVTGDRPFSATDVVRPQGDYGMSKWQGEQRLFRVAESSGMEAVVLRPPLVYGSGVQGNFLKLISWIDKGAPLPFASIANARSLISVWNLCDLIVRMVEAPPGKSGVFLASDGVDLSTPELIRQIAVAMNRPSRLLPLPASLFKLAAAMGIMRSGIERLCNSLTVDMTSTCESFGWRPGLSVDAGLLLTVRWYLDRK